MFPGAKIIAVDDDENGLEQIVSTLRRLRMACVAYHYPDPDLGADANFCGVRLVFMDIQLVGGTSPGAGNVYDAPISVLRRTIREDNGPYALITWSNNPSWYDGLLVRMKETPAMTRRQPFYTVSLDKNAYAADAEKLRIAVSSIISGNPAFGALLDWERRVAAAGENVLRMIGTFSEQFEGATPSDKVDHLLSKLAADAFGKEHVKDHLFEAVNEALLPLLTDALNTQFFSEDRNRLWEAAVTKSDEVVALDVDASSKLNSAVLFDHFDGIKPYRRGAVLALPELPEDAFLTRFGAKPDALRGALLKIDIPKKLQWILVQIQAACDFSQPKQGPLPYLLGAVIPADFTPKKDTIGQALARPKSVWTSPELAPIDGVCSTRFQIAVLHGISFPMTRKAIAEANYRVLGRFKDQVISAIAHEHHSHGSRPGFVSFQSS